MSRLKVHLLGGRLSVPVMSAECAFRLTTHTARVLITLLTNRRQRESCKLLLWSSARCSCKSCHGTTSSDPRMNHTQQQRSCRGKVVITQLYRVCTHRSDSGDFSNPAFQGLQRIALLRIDGPRLVTSTPMRTDAVVDAVEPVESFRLPNLSLNALSWSISHWLSVIVPV